MPQVDEGNVVASRRRTLTLNSDLAELDRLRAFVEGFCGAANVSDETCFRVSLALEELFVNSVTHGECNPPAGAIRLAMQVEGGRLKMDYSDNGIPYDLLSIPAPNLAENVRARGIGGLGVHLIRCLIAEIRHERRDGRNCLFLATSIGAATDPGRTEGNAHADCDGDRAR